MDGRRAPGVQSKFYLQFPNVLHQVVSFVIEQSMTPSKSHKKIVAGVKGWLLKVAKTRKSPLVQFLLSLLQIPDFVWRSSPQRLHQFLIK